MTATVISKRCQSGTAPLLAICPSSLRKQGPMVTGRRSWVPATRATQVSLAGTTARENRGSDSE
jgi:hypothetical protein